MKSKIKVISAALLSLGCLMATAQEKPPIRIFIGFSAGGNGDILARLMAEELRPILGRNVIVENRPGAGGRLAAQALKAAPTDGSNYMLQPDAWAIFATILYTEAQLHYSYKKDFAPVARYVSFPLGFYAAEHVKANNLKEYVEAAKKDQNLTLFGSSGTGGITDLLGLLMSKEFGVKMSNVPFKGGGDVKSNLMGGQLSVGIVTPGDGIAEVGTKVKPLGFFTENRWEIAPNIPTFKEQGFNITNGGAFSGFWTSSQTPEAERKKMEMAMKEVLSKKSVQERLAKIYVKADFGDSQTFGKQIDDLINYWTPIVDESGLRNIVNNQPNK